VLLLLLLLLLLLCVCFVFSFTLCPNSLGPLMYTLEGVGIYCTGLGLKNLLGFGGSSSLGDR
jgi:hypothetical protein